jgi:hypothetical protein
LQDAEKQQPFSGIIGPWDGPCDEVAQYGA